MSDEIAANCPICGKLTKNRLMSIPLYMKMGGCQTLGSLADKNARELGSYQKDSIIQKMANERRASRSYHGAIPEGAAQVDLPTIPKRPIWRPDSDVADTKLLSGTPDQINDYVLTGKRPPNT